MFVCVCVHVCACTCTVAYICMGIHESSSCGRKCDFEHEIKFHGLDITSLAILCKGLCVLGRGQAWDTCIQAERGVTILSHLNLNNVTLGRGGHALWSVPKKKNTHTHTHTHCSATLRVHYFGFGDSQYESQ